MKKSFSTQKRSFCTITAILLVAAFVFGSLPAFIGATAETAKNFYAAVKAVETKGSGPKSGTIDGCIYWQYA